MDVKLRVSSIEKRERRVPPPLALDTVQVRIPATMLLLLHNDEIAIDDAFAKACAIS